MPGSRWKKATMKPTNVAMMARIEVKQAKASRHERVATRRTTKPTHARPRMHAFASSKGERVSAEAQPGSARRRGWEHAWRASGQAWSSLPSVAAGRWPGEEG